MAIVTGSHLIGRALKLEGVSNVFTLAGDHILPVLDVMEDLDFRFIDTRHEQAAVHMADAWGRITGQIGVCMYTTPGFANAIPGLTNALHSEAPLLSIAGCADLADLGRGAMQEIDQVGMAVPVAKGSFMVHDARRIPDFIARAVRLAYSGRHGPVHLTIPIDVQEQEVDEDQLMFYNPDEYRAAESMQTQPDLVAQYLRVKCPTLYRPRNDNTPAHGPTKNPSASPAADTIGNAPAQTSWSPIEPNGPVRAFFNRSTWAPSSPEISARATAAAAIPAR